MPQSDFRHSHRLRVRYGEGDQQGVVFNARYLDYGDIAVTEYWRAVGFRFVGEDVMEFHVAHASVDFKKPIRRKSWYAHQIRIEVRGKNKQFLLRPSKNNATEIPSARVPARNHALLMLKIATP